MTARLGHVPALDGIRGIAIALVVGAHYLHGSWQAGGAVGVEMFFVLSGFLITTLLLEEHDRDGAVDLKRFYLRRSRRLFPALFTLLAVYVALRGLPGVETAALAGLYFGNIVIAYTGLSHVIFNSSLSHLWSLAQEEQFYLLWPIFLTFLLRRRLTTWMPAVLASFLGWNIAVVFFMPGVFGPNHLYWSPDTNAAWLLAGCTLAFYRRSGRLIRTAAFPVAIAAIAAFWLAIDHLHGWYAMQIVAIGGYCILIGVAYSGGLAARLLTFAPLVWLGQISYSLYLWHRPILYALHKDAIVALPISLLVAWVSYRYIEQPFRRGAEVMPPVAATGHGSP